MANNTNTTTSEDKNKEQNKSQGTGASAGQGTGTGSSGTGTGEGTGTGSTGQGTGTGTTTQTQASKPRATYSDSKSIEEVLAKILEQETTEEAATLRRLALQRVAMENDTVRARIPAPLNITEIGGYYNLLENDPEMKRMMLASILGLPYSY